MTCSGSVDEMQTLNQTRRPFKANMVHWTPATLPHKWKKGCTTTDKSKKHNREDKMDHHVRCPLIRHTHAVYDRQPTLGSKQQAANCTGIKAKLVAEQWTEQQERKTGKQARKEAEQSNQHLHGNKKQRQQGNRKARQQAPWEA